VPAPETLFFEFDGHFQARTVTPLYGEEVWKLLLEQKFSGQRLAVYLSGPLAEKSPDPHAAQVWRLPP